MDPELWCRQWRVRYIYENIGIFILFGSLDKEIQVVFEDKKDSHNLDEGNFLVFRRWGSLRLHAVYQGYSVLCFLFSDSYQPHPGDCRLPWNGSSRRVTAQFSEALAETRCWQITFGNSDLFWNISEGSVSGLCIRLLCRLFTKGTTVQFWEKYWKTV